MAYSRISGTGSYLPKDILTNQQLEQMVETTDEWIKKRVGIEQRHYIAESADTVSSMAAQASKQAIEAAGLTPADIDMIVVGTATSENFFPSTACLLHKQLGIESEIPAFDLNAACSGFIYALSVADQFIRSGQKKHILVVGVDALTKMVDWNDRSTCILFGDGAGAVVLSASDERGVIETMLRADGRYDEALFASSPIWDSNSDLYVHMKGHEVFRIAVTKLGEIVDQLLDKAGYKQSQIDWLIPHQANWRIIKATAKKLNLPLERVVKTVNQHGNTSAASVPLALDFAVRSGKVKRGDTLLLEAFGAGLAWGAALLEY